MKLSFTKLMILLLLSSIGSYAQKKKVACIGDSITDGPGLARENTYPGLLQGFLGSTDYEVRNYGSSGKTLLKHGDFPYWTDQKYADAKAWQPDIVIIKFGTNDAKPQNWGSYSTEFESDYTAMINEFKNSGANPTIFLVYPIVAFPNNGMILDNTLTGEIIPKITNIASQNNVNTIDLHTPFNGKSNFVPDLIHPNRKGNNVMAYTIASKICTTCVLPNDALRLIAPFDYTDLSTSVASSAGGSTSGLTDNDGITGVVQTYAQNMSYTVLLPSDIKLTGYAITPGTDITKNPKSWRLEASSDGSTWINLSTQTDINLLPSETIVTDVPYSMSTNLTPYNQYRLIITANNGGSQLEIRELQFFGFPDKYTKDISSNGGSTSSLVNGFTPAESVNSLVDKNVDTKFCGPFGNNFGWVQYDSPTAQKVYKYSITSCASVRETDRDPKSWKLYGSNNGTDWTLMDTRTNQTFLTRNQTLEYTVNSQSDFLKFRLQIDGIVSGNVVQFSEWHLSSELEVPIPASLGIQGSAVSESVSTINMKKIGDRFEIYTSLKTGLYSFAGDSDIIPINITVSGASAPYKITVDYSSGNAIVTAKKVNKVIVCSPWGLYTVGELAYAGNSSFKARGLSHSGLWGGIDYRYRIKIYLEGGIEETYARGSTTNDQPPTNSTPQSYYDLFINGNGQWDGTEFKIAEKYLNEAKLFDVEVILAAGGNYTHKITDYVPDLVIADDLTLSGSALEGTTAMFKKAGTGIFEFVGGLKTGSFTISGTANSQTYNYTSSNNSTVQQGSTALNVTSTLKPFYVKVNLVNQTIVIQEITAVNLYMSASGNAGSDRIELAYQGNGKFQGTKASLVWPAQFGGDSRYKFKMDLANSTSVFLGSINKDNQPPADNLPTGAYYDLFSVDNTDYDYSFKLRDDTRNQQVTVGLAFKVDGSFNHKYLIGTTLPLILINFKGTEENGKVKLVWNTENEVNFRGFELEKSTDGLSFYSLGSVAANKSTGKQQYALIDNQMLPSTTFYYRLKMIDNDGAVKSSNVIALKTSGLQKDVFTVYYSTDSYLHVLHPIAENNAVIKIYGIDGRLLNTVKVQKGNTDSKVNISSLSTGVYALGFVDNNHAFRTKFVK